MHDHLYEVSCPSNAFELLAPGKIHPGGSFRRGLGSRVGLSLTGSLMRPGTLDTVRPDGSTTSTALPRRLQSLEGGIEGVVEFDRHRLAICRNREQIRVTRLHPMQSSKHSLRVRRGNSAQGISSRASAIRRSHPRGESRGEAGLARSRTICIVNSVRGLFMIGLMGQGRSSRRAVRASRAAPIGGTVPRVHSSSRWTDQYGATRL